MPDVYRKWSAYTAAGTLSGSEQIAVVKSGASVRTTAKEIANTADTLGAFTSGAHTPTTDDGAALGSIAKQWSDLFFASGGVINWNNGNVTITHSAGLLTLAGALTLTGALNGAAAIKSSSASAGIGYATGAGGTVTQATSRTTGVTLDKVCGSITTHNASLAAGASATFTVTNSAVAATDVPVLVVKSGQTNRETAVAVTAVAAGSFDITVHNQHASVAEVGAIVINFALLKAVAA